MVGGGCATKEVAAPGFRHNFHSNFHGIIHMGPVYRDLELEALRRGVRLAREPVRARLPRRPRAGAAPASSTRPSSEHRPVLDARRSTFRELAHVVPAGARRRHDPGDVLPARPAERRPARRSRRSVRRPRADPPVPVGAEPRGARPVRVARGADVDRVLGGAARRDRRRVRPGRELPGHAGRLAWSRTGWAICKGGSNRLAQAMVAFLEAHGGEVRLNAPVAPHRRGRRRGPRGRAGRRRAHPGRRHPGVEPGSEAHVPGPGRRGRLPASSLRPCKRWRYDVMSMFCVYLALDAPVRWKAAADEPEVERCFAVSLCESLDVLDDNA